MMSKEEALQILRSPDARIEELLKEAYRLRKKYKGNRVHVQLLTNVRSGNCTQDCAYCAQSHQSTAPIHKYQSVSEEKLLNDSRLVKEKRLSRHCIGLSGISFSDKEIEELAEKISKMKKNGTQVCCSIGFLTKTQSLMLKKAGLDRINHNLNSSRRFYPSICSTHTYDDRINNIKMLKETGFEICCGGIVGMGESEMDIVDMLFEIKEINPESVPINFLLPVKGTRLEEQDVSKLTTEYCLKILILARLLLPKSDIRCAAGREAYFCGHEKQLFQVADSIFANGYLTEAGQSLEDTLRLIEELGFTSEIEGMS